MLSKPYSREDLARKVRHQLENAAQRKTASLDGRTTTVSAEVAVHASGLTILVCEDDPLIRMSVVDMLGEIGHTAVEAPDARTALALLEQQEFDILVTDIGLPDMTGIELTAMVRTDRPSLPVIFATGHAEYEGLTEDEKTQRIGKPFDAQELARAIRMFEVAK